MGRVQIAPSRDPLIGPGRAQRDWQALSLAFVQAWAGVGPGARRRPKSKPRSGEGPAASRVRRARKVSEAPGAQNPRGRLRGKLTKE